MSGNKTEKPTQKKKRDAAQKGQSFKSKDLIISCLILAGVSGLQTFSELTQLMQILQKVIAADFKVDMMKYTLALAWIGIKIFLPFLLFCIMASVLPTLLQTGFIIASKALKLNFGAINPANGFKKLFSLRVAKDFVKSLLLLVAFYAAARIFWNKEKNLIFSQLNSSPAELFFIWGELLRSLIYICLGCLVLIILLDALAEYFIHIKDLKMDKQEVKREHKEQEGDPEIKSKRKELHMELLSEQDKSDIEKSKAIIANPTHIAIGIFLNPEIIPIPFISVVATNQRALAVRAYAKKVGVPVVENIRLARRIFHTHKRYSFVSLEELDNVMEILIWLEEVENAWMLEKH